jgi:2,4-dienoyl-CoA reductase-like NADH-dependent reductase (Old Yellow Enzyme family)
VTSQLFSPYRLGNLELSNRIVVSPMCQYSSRDGCLQDWHLMHLGQFAVSGPGLIIIEMTNVQPGGRITPYCSGLYNQETEDAMKRVIDYVKGLADVPVAIQLAHAGRKASSLRPWEGGGALAVARGGWETVAPCAISHADEVPGPRALSSAEIEQLVHDFAAAAVRAERIGFDAIELHGAHGYLLHQFLSPLSNQREDGYGGSLENRIRFPLEVYRAVRDAWPEDKPLGMRISATDWIDGGWDLDQSLVLARELQQRGCDFLDVSSGGLSSAQQLSPGPGYQVPFAERIRKETGMAVITVGLITDPLMAEDIVSDGKADLVALARGFLYDPRWVWHAAKALGEDFSYPEQYLRCAPGQ